MAHFRLRLFHFLTLALILLPAARAYDFPPISDEEKNFKEVPGQPGAPAAILYREEEDDDYKNHYHMTYVRMKILTEAGRKYADVVAEFQKGFSNIENVSARTVHADGTIIPFDGKVYDKEVLKARGYKIHAKSFTLPDVQVAASSSTATSSAIRTATSFPRNGSCRATFGRRRSISSSCRLTPGRTPSSIIVSKA